MTFDFGNEAESLWREGLDQTTSLGIATIKAALQRAHAAGVAQGREEGKYDVLSLWRAFLVAARSTADQYVPLEFIQFCGSPSEFIRRVEACTDFLLSPEVAEFKKRAGAK